MKRKMRNLTLKIVFYHATIAQNGSRRTIFHKKSRGAYSAPLTPSWIKLVSLAQASWKKLHSSWKNHGKIMEFGFQLLVATMNHVPFHVQVVTSYSLLKMYFHHWTHTHTFWHCTICKRGTYIKLVCFWGDTVCDTGLFYWVPVLLWRF